MDIKEYISSGIIETYVLGMATDDEICELERLCSEYSEVQRALDEARETLGTLAEKGSEPVPSGLKASIMETLIKEDLLDDVKNDMPAQLLASDKRLVGGYRKINRYALVAAACVLLLVFGAIYHFKTVNDLKSKLSILSAQQKSLLVENVVFREELENKKRALNLTAGAAVHKYTLAGVAGHEGSSATIYWDKSTDGVYLLPISLPTLPKGKQYQLWAIVDGKPKNAGVYTESDFSVLQQMLPTERAEMFAITIEKEGGSIEPTLEQMVVAAKI